MFDLRKHDIKQCSIDEFNEVLDKLSKAGRKFLYESGNKQNIGPRVYLWSAIAKAYVAFNVYSEKNIHTECYMTDLNDEYENGWLKAMTPTSHRIATVAKAMKLPKLINDKSEAVVHASGIIWTNKKYIDKNIYCYEYDMHLAWLSTFMMCKLPDTSVEPKRKCLVGPDAIGFLVGGYDDYNCGDSVVFSGYADYVFPTMTNPNPAYCEQLIKDINNAPNRLARKNKKSFFNEWLGNEQNHNPFIRVAVIAQSNAKIIDLIKRYKEKLVFSVTDSLGATERIPELDNMIGTRPGCWSIKNEGYLYCDHFNRLYLDNCGNITNSVIRGVPKKYIIGMNIMDYKELINKVDPTKNLYRVDNDLRKVIKNEKRA